MNGTRNRGAVMPRAMPVLKFGVTENGSRRCFQVSDRFPGGSNATNVDSVSDFGVGFCYGPTIGAGWFHRRSEGGADHEEGDLSPNSNWPAGLHAAVNQKNRVHGFWVNTTDVFFYRGGNREINSMIESLAAIKGVKARIILHAGARKARSPWGTDSGAANWSVTCYCKVGKGGIAFGKPDSIDMDVWISDKIGLGELKIPEKIAIENGGEI